MSLSRFFTIITALVVTGCAALPVNEKLNVQSQPPISHEKTTSVTLPRRAPYPSALAIVQEYYAAIAQKDIDSALSLLSYNVVHVEISPCAWQVTKGYQDIENELDHSNVLSFTVDNFQVNGNTITYTLTEWLDPRVVGPNFQQPARSHVTAVVNQAEITDFVSKRDLPLLAKEGDISQICTSF